MGRGTPRQKCVRPRAHEWPPCPAPLYPACLRPLWMALLCVMLRILMLPSAFIAPCVRLCALPCAFISRARSEETGRRRCVRVIDMNWNCSCACVGSACGVRSRVSPSAFCADIFVGCLRLRLAAVPASSCQAVFSCSCRVFYSCCEVLRCAA